MNRERYLSDSSVREFLEWVLPFVSGVRPFTQQWVSPKWGEWRCGTLFDAYLSYDWRFALTLPGEVTLRSGRTLSDSEDALGRLRVLLRESATAGDSAAFLEAALTVVRWGQVQRNEVRLRALGSRALSTLSDAASLLDPGTAELTRLAGVAPMNSGFSKIYSLMLEEFPIYDSRVACTLASLVRMHCEEVGLDAVPATLAFGIPASRGSVGRDPSTETLRFPRLWPGNPRGYARSNVMAAWLLRPLSAEGPFGELLPERRILALQSALFMVGYAPWHPEATRSRGRR